MKMDLAKYDASTAELIEKVFEQKRNISEDVLETLSRLEEAAYEIEDFALQGFVHFHIADALYTFEKGYAGFRENLAKAISFFELAGENELLARAYNYVAVDALNNGSFDVAYLYLMNAMHTCEKIENTYLLSIINNNIGQVYARMRSYEKAIDYVRIGNKLQALCSKDDFYYYQNMINGYFSEGMLCALAGDVEGAKEANLKIAQLEEETDVANTPSVFLPISMLRVIITILEGDEEEYEVRSKEIIEKLQDAYRVYDFITDVEDFCHLLIDYGKLDAAEEVIKVIKNTVEASPVIQMKKIISSLEIAYFEKMGDVEKVNHHLREQYHLAEQQQDEQNRIYQYSIDLLNIMNEQRKEQERIRLENERLQTQVQKDPLTGLANRLKLDDAIPSMLEDARKNGMPFAVSMMDIDKFKDYNDSYGHLAGDLCLQKVANAIQEVSDKHELFCARFGGDEFVMLYENKSDEEIMSIAQELAKRVLEEEISFGSMGERGRVSISQGICNSIPLDGQDQNDFLNEADNALYAVKKNIALPGERESVRLVHL